MLHRRAILLKTCLLAIGPTAAAQPAPTARVTRLVQELTIDQLAAQLVMPWIEGSYAASDGLGLDDAYRWIDSLQIGGVVVSIGSPLDIAAKLNALQTRTKLPLLVASDLEGGSAFRFVGGTAFPTNMGVAATGREADAYQMGRITALEGQAVGVHIAFAPVADVNSNPLNPVINTRSFGSDPAAVGKLVAATVRGIQSTGMLATAKHFPGHGDTDVDSHSALPIIRRPWGALSALELVPFRAAIDAGVGAIMSGHLAVPAIDSDSARPATLSHRIMTNALRDSLGFTGLVITDALDMGALVSRLGAAELAVRALEAGADLLLMPTDPAAAIQGVATAIRSGRITRTRLQRSVVRLLSLKERQGLFDRRTVPLGPVGDIVGARAFADTARSIAERSLVLVRDSLGTIERLRNAPGRMAIVSFGEASETSLGVAFAQGLTARGHRVLARHRLTPASGPQSYDSARVALAAAPVAVFAVAVRTVSARGSIGLPENLATLVRDIQRTTPTVVVSFGTPYLLNQLPDLGSLLLAWTANPITEAAAAAGLAGAWITGRLPIPLPPGYPVGHGLRRSSRAQDATSRH